MRPSMAETLTGMRGWASVLGTATGFGEDVIA
jgi:hypothetical protein